MQRFTFQLSIGGSRVMSTKETVDLEGSPKTRKKSEKKSLPNGGIIKAENEQTLQSDKDSSSTEKTKGEKNEMEKNKDKESDADKKPTGITKEDEEQIMNSFKNVPEEYRKSLINFFKAADTDNVGFLTIQKFAPAVRKLGYTGTDRAIAKMFIDINSNFDGEVTIQEFMTEMTKQDPRKRTDADMGGLFKKFDANKDGFITKDELEKTMDKIKMPRTNILVTDIIKRADHDGDGKISLEEFKSSCQCKSGQVLV